MILYNIILIGLLCRSFKSMTEVLYNISLYIVAS